MDRAPSTGRTSASSPTSALLIIDMQQALFGRPTPVYHGDELLANINSLVERAHSAGAPVVYIQHSNEGPLKTGTPG